MGKRSSSRVTKGPFYNGTSERLIHIVTVGAEGPAEFGIMATPAHASAILDTEFRDIKGKPIEIKDSVHVIIKLLKSG